MVEKTKKKGRRRPPPKNQQATSIRAIVRARLKDAIMEYRLLGYALRPIMEAINEQFGPTSDEPLPGFKPINRVATIHELLTEAITESVDPLKREELREVLTGQLNQLLVANMGPALQGSTPHAQTALNILDRIAKIHKIGDEGEGTAAGTQTVTVVISGVDARA